MRLETFYLCELREYALRGEEAPKEFRTIKYKDDDGNWQMHILGLHDTDSTFVRGHGTIKLAKRKITMIPVWDGEIETFNDYLAKYGYKAIYRSLTFRDYNNWDCVDYNAQREFRSILHYCLDDLAKYNEFVTKYRKFLELERKAVHKLIGYGNNGWFADFHLEHHRLRPRYTVMYDIDCPPTVTILDAEKHLRHLATEHYNQTHTSCSERFDMIEFETKYKEIDEIFKDKNVPQMVEHFYGKEAADLYVELEKMYAPEDTGEEDSKDE